METINGFKLSHKVVFLFSTLWLFASVKCEDISTGHRISEMAGHHNILVEMTESLPAPDQDVKALKSVSNSLRGGTSHFQTSSDGNNNFDEAHSVVLKDVKDEYQDGNAEGAVAAFTPSLGDSEGMAVTSVDQSLPQSPGAFTLHGESCGEDDDCVSGRCDKYLTCQPKLKDGEGTCGVDNDCVDGVKCTRALTCGKECTWDGQCSTGRCSKRLICDPKLSNGGTCGEDEDCKSGRCAEWEKCEKKLGKNQQCWSDTDCQSNKCKPNFWTFPPKLGNCAVGREASGC